MDTLSNRVTVLPAPSQSVVDRSMSMGSTERSPSFGRTGFTRSFANNDTFNRICSPRIAPTTLVSCFPCRLSLPFSRCPFLQLLFRRVFLRASFYRQRVRIGWLPQPSSARLIHSFRNVKPLGYRGTGSCLFISERDVTKSLSLWLLLTTTGLMAAVGVPVVIEETYFIIRPGAVYGFARGPLPSRRTPGEIKFLMKSLTVDFNILRWERPFI